MEEDNNKPLISLMSGSRREMQENNQPTKSTSIKATPTKTNKSPKKNEESKNKEREIKIGNYLIKKTLGKGTFGKVKLGIFLPKNKKVAVKILEKKRLKDEDDLIRLKREFEMLSQFSHPNVITVSEIFESTEAYFTIMEYCDGGELFNYIVINKYLSEEKSSFFFYQLINGLEYIHSLGIVHRDLKPENLLLTHDHILKIIDFGLSNYFKKDQLELLETPCGSPCYASPEMLSGESYNGFKIDIWASGIILFAMLCGFLPFDHKDNDKLFLKILECKIQYPKSLSKMAKDLLKKILVPDPNKRITIPEIKKHPFYLKGKEIFESNFTIYQVSRDVSTDSNESSSSIEYNTLDNNYILCEKNYKSEIMLNRFKDLYFKNMNFRRKRYNTLEFNRFISDVTIKKLIDLDKKIKKIKKKLQKEKKISDKKEYNEKNDSSQKDTYLKYNHSSEYQINDISFFCENLINNYKKEEKNKINTKLDDDKNNNKTKKDIEINKSNKLKQKSNNKKNKNINKNEDNNNKNTYIKNIIDKIKVPKNISEEKEKGTNLRNAFHPDKKNNKKEQHNYNKYNIIQQNNTNINSQNTKLLNKSQNNNYIISNIKNNIKVNIKKRTPIKINKLFINKHQIPKINKLPTNTKLKKINRKMKSTSSNNSRTKNFKNILNVIKQQSLKPNINVINRQNIVHHHTTNITNMTQKNYFSNVIINNYKSREEHKNYSTSQSKSKAFNISEINNEKYLINDYLQKNNKQGLDSTKMNISNNLKFKNNLQKLILKEEILMKNNSKNSSKNKNLAEATSNTVGESSGTRENSTIRNKLSANKKTEAESRTIPNTNDRRRRYFKTKMKKINNYILNNNMKNMNKKSINTENTFGQSLMNMNNLDYMNNSKKDKFVNSYVNTINNCVESREQTQTTLYKKKKKYEKLLSTNINLNLNLDKKYKNKINNSSVENNSSNRSYNYNNISNFDICKMGNLSNLLFNCNNTAFKKIENIKKNNLYSILSHRKCPKLNLKELFGIDNIFKKDNNSLSINYQKQIQSQRNKPTVMNNINNNIHKNFDGYHYLNSVRNTDCKNTNNSYNIGNNSRLIGSNISCTNTPFYINHLSNISKFKTIQNNMRTNKDLNNTTQNNNNHIYTSINNIENINDNIKMNSILEKNKTAISSKQTIGSHRNSNNNYNIMNKHLYQKNRLNLNAYNDKYIESKKLFLSLRKRINFKSNLMNNTNGNIYLEKKVQNKTQNNSRKNKEKDNSKKGKNKNNNSLIIKILKSKQANNNTYNYNIKKNNLNEVSTYNNKIKSKINEYSFRNEKKNHKKIKSMKCNIINQKSKVNPNRLNSNNIKNLNIEINNASDVGLYICNTQGNSNTINYINILDNNKFNTIETNSNRFIPQYQFSNINNQNNQIIKK